MFLPGTYFFRTTLTDLLSTLFNTVVFTQHSSWINILQLMKRICLRSWSFLFFSYTPIPRSGRTNTNWEGHWGLSCYASWVTKTCHTTMTTIYHMYTKYCNKCKSFGFYLASSSSSSSSSVCMLSYVWLCDHAQTCDSVIPWTVGHQAPLSMEFFFN